MAIRYRCSNCNQLLSIATRMAGKTVTCPACKNPTQVPVPEQKPAAVALPIAPEQLREDLERSENEEDAGPDSQAQISTVGLPLWTSPAPGEDDEGEPELLVRRRKLEFEEMDLTPMVDVTFLLLIFFMITASFTLHKALAVPPPESEQDGARQSIQTLDDLLNDSIKVEVDEKNELVVDDEPLAAGADLAALLQDKMRVGQKAELIVIANAEAHHETVVRVVDAANEAGMQRIRLTTRGGPQDE